MNSPCIEMAALPRFKDVADRDVFLGAGVNVMMNMCPLPSFCEACSSGSQRRYSYKVKAAAAMGDIKFWRSDDVFKQHFADNVLATAGFDPGSRPAGHGVRWTAATELTPQEQVNALARVLCPGSTPGTVEWVLAPRAKFVELALNCGYDRQTRAVWTNSPRGRLVLTVLPEGCCAATDYA